MNLSLQILYLSFRNRDDWFKMDVNLKYIRKFLLFENHYLRFVNDEGENVWTLSLWK